MLNAFSLFGIIPGILLKYLSPKKTAVLGGIMVVIGLVMTVLMVSTDHAEIVKNPAWMLGSICVISGQGSCLIFFSSMQALMNMQTIQASHVISTCLVSYYLGADSYIMSIKDGLLADTKFTDFMMQIAIGIFVITVINGVVITDQEDASGFFGKAEALTKGIIYKKTNYMHLVILLVYTLILMGAQFLGSLKDSSSAIILIILVFINLFVPVSLIFLLDADKIKSWVGEPSDIEKKLSNKGGDLTISETLVRIDFWYLSITSMIVIGTSRLFDENAMDLGLHDEDKENDIQQAYSVYEVVGAVVTGSLLTFFRSKLRPSAMIVLLIPVGMLGMLGMVYPSIAIGDAMFTAAAAAAFAEGGIMVSLASLVHEEYGTENFGIFYGTFLTFGAVGLYAYDEIFFPNIMTWYASETKNGYFHAYGEWSKYLFTCLAASYFVVFWLALISNISIGRKEKADSSKLVMVKF